jgi:hypothetical protein
MHPLRRPIESKQLDGDEAVSLRIVGAENGTERARPYLMKNPEWSERVWRRDAGNFGVQRDNSCWKAVQS